MLSYVTTFGSHAFEHEAVSFDVNLREETLEFQRTYDYLCQLLANGVRYGDASSTRSEGHDRVTQPVGLRCGITAGLTCVNSCCCESALSDSNLVCSSRALSIIFHARAKRDAQQLAIAITPSAMRRLPFPPSFCGPVLSPAVVLCSCQPPVVHRLLFVASVADQQSCFETLIDSYLGWD